MIPYIKKYKVLLSDCLYCTIFFIQSLYWYGKMNRPYYKFLKPCTHPLCEKSKDNNWMDDLGFSEYQVKSVLRKIGTKLKKGKEYNLLECGLILYWNAGNGLTFYCPNYPKLSSMGAYLQHFKEDFPHFRKWYNDFSKIEKSSFKIVFYPSKYFNFTDSYIQENTQEINQENTQKKEQSSSTPNNLSSNEKGEKKEKNSAKKEKEDLDVEIVYPFESAKFKSIWTQWKIYKKEQHGFTYSMKGEQVSLMQLSAYDESFAIQLLQSAIANDWKQFHFSDTLTKYKKYHKNGKLNNKKTNPTKYNGLYKKYS